MKELGSNISYEMNLLCIYQFKYFGEWIHIAPHVFEHVFKHIEYLYVFMNPRNRNVEIKRRTPKREIHNLYKTNDLESCSGTF